MNQLKIEQIEEEIKNLHFSVEIYLKFIPYIYKFASTTLAGLLFKVARL